MLEFLIIVLFICLLVWAIRLLLKAAWGVAKIVAILLVVAACPTLLGILLAAGGLALLIPILLLGVAFLILKVCL